MNFNRILLQSISIELELVDVLIKILTQGIEHAKKKRNEFIMDRLYERRFEKETSW